ncbi:hypothetical protein [Pseudomonas sp. XK-1]|uniref:hypothetical protein n=1 Tax=Pseudomonas sp. XK-1 TaxID=3136019 RepID=UPI00311911E6
MSTHEITEPLFITEEIEAEMIAAGYVFDVPKLITLPHDYNKALELEEGSGDPTVSAE